MLGVFDFTPSNVICIELRKISLQMFLVAAPLCPVKLSLKPRPCVAQDGSPAALLHASVNVLSGKDCVEQMGDEQYGELTQV